MFINGLSVFLCVFEKIQKNGRGHQLVTRKWALR